MRKDYLMHFVLNFPFSGLFCLFLPICLLIKCEIKYTCIATSPWDDPLLFFSRVKTKRWSQYFHCSLADYAQDSAEKLNKKKKKTNILLDLPFMTFCSAHLAEQLSSILIDF